MTHRTAWLHVGAGKTGTSAIQTWLARNHGRLEEHGILYPPPLKGFANAAAGRITSGNAGLLAGFCATASEAAPHLSLTPWLDGVGRHAAATALFSNEGLQKGDPGKLRQVKEMLEERGFQVRIVYAVRNAADHAFSKWGLMVKRGERSEHGAWERHLACDTLRFPEVLDRFAGVFGKASITVINYERAKHDIVRRFLSVITPVDFGDTQVERVNRSLSAHEMELMHAFNRAVARLTGNARLRIRLARGLSAFLVYGADAPPLKLSLTEEQRAALEARHGEAIERLNREYLPDEPILVADPKIVTGPMPTVELGPEERDLMERLAARAVARTVDLATLEAGGDCLGAVAALLGETFSGQPAHHPTENASWFRPIWNRWMGKGVRLNGPAAAAPGQ